MILYITIIFGVICSIIEVYYEFYLTAIVHFISLTILFTLAKSNYEGINYRISIAFFYLLAYIFTVITRISGFSTKSPPTVWSDNTFTISDANIALVSFTAFIAYAVLMMIHRLSVIIAKSSSLNTQKSVVELNLNNFSGFNSKRYLFLIIMLSILVLIVQNYFGWGVHGLPPYSGSIFKGIGILIYARDIFIPATLGYFLYKGTYKSFILPIVFSFLVILLSLSSISKVTLIVYSMVLFLSLLRINFLHIKPLKFIKSKIFFVFIIILVSFILQNILREIHLSLGEPIRLQTILAVDILLNINSFNALNLDLTTHLASMIERMQGFYELASVLFTTQNGDSYTNLLHYTFSINQEGAPGYTSIRSLTGSTQGGGVGLDLVGTIVMVREFFLIPFIFILVIFTFQNIIINSFHQQSRIVEFFFIILTLRFLFIDANYFVWMQITSVLFIMLLFYQFLKKNTLDE
jgi:hypothetical protein